MSDDVIRQFPGVELPDNPMAIAQRKPGFCQHDKIVLDEHMRTVTCAQCGAALDAFVFLLNNARTIQIAWQHHHGVMQKVREIGDRVDALKREEQRLRAIVKRLQEKSGAVLDVRAKTRL